MLVYSALQIGVVNWNSSGIYFWVFWTCSCSISLSTLDIPRDAVKAFWHEGWIERMWASWHISVALHAHTAVACIHSKSSPISWEFLRGCTRQGVGGWFLILFTNAASIGCWRGRNRNDQWSEVPGPPKTKEHMATATAVVANRKIVATRACTMWACRASCNSSHLEFASTKVWTVLRVSCSSSHLKRVLPKSGQCEPSEQLLWLTFGVLMQAHSSPWCKLSLNSVCR